MNQSGGFISLGLALGIAIVAAAVLGGAGWWVTKNQSAGTEATTDVCAGRDASKPFIGSISPIAGPVGTEVTIRGCNLSGFEADLEATFERSDGALLIPIYAGTLYRKTPEVAEYQEMKFTLQSYCPSGSVTGLYSGIEQQCKPVIANPDVYKVSVHTPGGTSNVVNFTISADTSSQSWPTIQSFTGPSSLAVEETGVWNVEATSPRNEPVTFVVTWGDEQDLNPEYRDVTHPLNRAKLGYGETFTSTTVRHTYKKTGTYTIRLLAFGADASRSSGEKTLTVTVRSSSDMVFKVTRPNGGESVKAGQKISIGWSTDGKTLGGNGNNVVTLSLIAKTPRFEYRDGQKQVDERPLGIANVVAGDLSYEWAPPASLAGDSYKLAATLSDGTCVSIGPLPYQGATCMAMARQLATDESDTWFSIIN